MGLGKFRVWGLGFRRFRALIGLGKFRVWGLGLGDLGH